MVGGPRRPDARGRARPDGSAGRSGSGRGVGQWPGGEGGAFLRAGGALRKLAGCDLVGYVERQRHVHCERRIDAGRRGSVDAELIIRQMAGAGGLVFGELLIAPAPGEPFLGPRRVRQQIQY